MPTSAFAELLIDCEEDRVLRAVLVGMLREADRSQEPNRESSCRTVNQRSPKYDPDSPRYCLPPAQVARGLRG